LRPYLKNPSQKRDDGVVQGVDPDFKPQYSKKGGKKEGRKEGRKERPTIFYLLA
jgi:hypothetical protein